MKHLNIYTPQNIHKVHFFQAVTKLEIGSGHSKRFVEKLKKACPHAVVTTNG